MAGRYLSCRKRKETGMCVECGCEVPETEEEVHDGKSVLHVEQTDPEATEQVA
jgi:hypothetical protein